MSRSRLVAALVAAPLLVAPPASAHDMDPKATGARKDCALGQCRVSVTHYTAADAVDCHRGPDGGITACFVTHRCQIQVVGLLMTGTLDCSGVGVTSCTWGSGMNYCEASLSGRVAVANGWCVPFDATGSVTDVGGGAQASPETMYVCVDRYGPYRL